MLFNGTEKKHERNSFFEFIFVEMGEVFISLTEVIKQERFMFILIWEVWEIIKSRYFSASFAFLLHWDGMLSDGHNWMVVGWGSFYITCLSRVIW